jgi:hypothetical protein
MFWERSAANAKHPLLSSDPTKQQQWNAFIHEVAINPGSLSEVIGEISSFLMPQADKARSLGGN